MVGEDKMLSNGKVSQRLHSIELNCNREMVRNDDS